MLSGHERTHSARTAPRCEYLYPTGKRCGSPALRDYSHCYFHHRAHRPVLFQHIPLEDPNAVQCALMLVIEGISTGLMDYRTAGLLLYGLQLASHNVKHCDFSAPEHPVTELDGEIPSPKLSALDADIAALEHGDVGSDPPLN